MEEMTETDVSTETVTEDNEVSESLSEVQAPNMSSSEESLIGEESDLRDELPDFEMQAEEDYRILREKFPEIAAYGSIAEMPNCDRFAYLRDLGLTTEEAYRAVTPGVHTAPVSRKDGKLHLGGGVPKRAALSDSGMSYSEMAASKELFSDLSPREILSLYRRAKQTV